MKASRSSKGVMTAAIAAVILMTANILTAGPIPVSGSYTSNYEPNLAVYEDHVAVMWRRTVGTAGGILQAYSTDGGQTFGGASVFSNGGSWYRPYSSNLGYDGNGTLHQTWVYWNDTTAPAYRKSTDHGATWSDVVYPGPYNLPRNGGIAVAYSSDGTDIQQVYRGVGNSQLYEVSMSDGTWDAGSSLLNWSGDINGLAMYSGYVSSGTYDADGNFFASYFGNIDHNANDGVGVLIKKPESANWDNFILDPDYTTASLANEHSILASGDNLYVVYSVSGNIYLRSSSDEGTTWSSAIQVDGALSGDQVSPVLGMDPNGGLHVAWQDNRTGIDQIFYAESQDGLNWTESWLSPSSMAQTQPDMVVTGMVPQLVWIQNDSVMYYTIPEPASLALLGMGSMLLLKRRHRKSTAQD